MSRNPPRYRALLPITTPHSRPALPPSTSVSALGPEPVPKRKATRVACRECHEKKRKCDGQKPSCAPCKRDGQHCIYRTPFSNTANEALRLELETLRRRYDVLESFVTNLGAAPYAGALQTLYLLRSSTSGWPENIDTLTGRAQAADLSELVAVQFSSSEESYHMDLAEQAQGDCCNQRLWAPDHGSASFSDANLGLVKKASDPRLRGLNIAFWTEVPVTDIFAKDAISSYLRSDHGIWELFDADAFLSDLVSQKSDFCSAFLVNCLLAFASQTYATSCPSATSKGLQFEEAAGSLWQADATRLDSETALTGLILLYLCFATRWEFDNADQCLRQIFNMAVRMKLFGVEERVSDFDMSLLKADRRSSMIHAAWGAFNTMSMHRKRLLGDAILLPPLVASPSTPSPITNISEDKSPSTDSIIELEPEI